MQRNLTDLRQRWNKAKLTKTTAFWIAVGAILLTMLVGFTQAGWVTDGTAQQRTEIAVQTAVTGRLAPICVVQFNQDLDKEQKLAAMKELVSANQRARYVIEQGWATMPGEAKAEDKVASECARQIMLLGE